MDDDVGLLAELETKLTPHLGTTVPEMPIGKAAARRLRRVYVYLFAVQGLAWLLKLASHPEPAASAREAIERGALGPLPGPVLVAISGLALLLAIGLAVARGGVSERRLPD